MRKDDAIMNKIIEGARSSDKGYKMTTEEIKILCYADDTVIKSKNEDDLQRLLHSFVLTARKYNMQISAVEIKSVVI